MDFEITYYDQKTWLYHVKSKVNILCILHILGCSLVIDKEFSFKLVWWLPRHFVHYYVKTVQVEFGPDNLPHSRASRRLKNDQIG